MNYFAGIDIGSSSIKIVILDEVGKSIAHKISPTGSSFNKNAQLAFFDLLNENSILKDEVSYIISTGYGRKLFKNADENISEITANAKGAVSLGKEFGIIKTIINIGGQDSKVISLDENGFVKNFAMNDKCAAGTGRFLEMVSRNLEIDIEDLGILHLAYKGAPLAVNSTCAVFAESEIISLLANEHGIGEIIKGVHYSIAKKISRLANRVGVDDLIMFEGGTALNQGMKEALEDELMREVFVPENPQLTTAFGAAIIAKERQLLLEKN